MDRSTLLACILQQHQYFFDVLPISEMCSEINKLFYIRLCFTMVATRADFSTNVPFVC